jgi:hypothetical protein
MAESNAESHVLKVLILGDPATGKVSVNVVGFRCTLGRLRILFCSRTEDTQFLKMSFIHPLDAFRLCTLDIDH